MCLLRTGVAASREGRRERERRVKTVAAIEILQSGLTVSATWAN